MLEGAAALGEGVDDMRLHQHRADRLVAAAETLGDDQQVGHHTFRLAGVQRAAAAHAAHHLVQDQQDAVAVAELAHALASSRARACTAPSVAPTTVSATKAMTFSPPEVLDLRFQLGRQSLAVGLGAFAGAPVAVGVAGRDMGDIDQQRRELLAPPGVAADCQRTQRIAVVALPPGDEMPALRLAGLDEVLSRHLQRRLDRLGSARHEVGVADARRRILHQQVGQFLGRWVVKKLVCA